MDKGNLGKKPYVWLIMIGGPIVKITKKIGLFLVNFSKVCAIECLYIITVDQLFLLL